jgi:hypothetical protein
MHELIIGTSAYPDASVELLREAGIGWLRSHFPVPFEDRLYCQVSERYQEARQRAEEWVAQGFQVMGTTPGVGIATRRPACKITEDQTTYPAFNGLVMVYVQASWEAGSIRVEAASEGLTAASAIIEIAECTPGPLVPSCLGPIEEPTSEQESG